VIRFGDFRLHVLSDGTIGADGGAMFGVVPRVLWEQTDPPDEKNRVTLGLNVPLVEAGGKRILVDPGLGDKWGPKEARNYRIERRETLLDGLRGLGLGPDDIDVVVDTHLHYDHVGGNTQLMDGMLRPTFPRARYVIQAGEWEAAVNPDERSRPSYVESNFVPLAEAGQVDLVRGDAEIAPGVRVERVGGHTAHLQMVLFESGGETLAVPTDLLPTTSHLPPAFVMSYDLFPLETIQAKRTLLDRAAEGSWLILFYHDARTRVGRVRQQGGRHVLSEVIA
jgi:glyoxylase-like metal-dependent hydrolase (beta-lactamase superfamily II)